MRPARRQALGLAGGMGVAALLATLGQPVRREPDAQARLDLDRLIPSRFPGWQVDPATQAFVRPADRQGKRFKIYDQVLERTFVSERGERIMLSMAFGAEQSANMQLHRPEVCYRGSGFEVRGTEPALLKLVGRDVPATRLQATMPGRPESITYWTLLGGDVVADADSFRWKRLSFAARREVAEGLLVRVSSIDPNAPRAYALHLRFAEALAQALPAAERDKLIGRAAS